MKLIRLFLMLSIFLPACSEISDLPLDEGGTIPQSLRKGDKIVLSMMSPLCFGFFKVTGPGEGQWAEAETAFISTSFSQATFQYSVTGADTAILTSQNYQSKTGRRWDITLNMKFNTSKTGTYVLRDVAIGTAASYTTSGSFEIK